MPKFEGKEGIALCNRRLVSLVSQSPVCCARGSGSTPAQTNTQGLKITEEKVLPFL